MATYNFKNLEVWQIAIKLTKKVYSLVDAFPEYEKYGLTNQIRRAMVSVSSNIAEGSARLSYKDQAKFYQYAYSSLIETISQLNLAVELEYLDKKKLEIINVDFVELTNKLNRIYKSTLLRVKEPFEEYQQINESTDQRVNRSTSQQFNNNGLIKKEDYQFQYTALIDENCKIGKGTKIWHFSHIMSNCTIGENCNIGQNVVVSPDVVLGNNVKVQNNVSIYTGVTCEDDVFLGPSMVFTNVTNPRSAVNRRGQYAKTHVGKGASIGANATIVCGHDIGAFAFIGAGAVITKNVKAYALVVGNPAKQIGWMSEYGHRLVFDSDGKTSCKESGEKYVLELIAGEEHVHKT